MDCNEAADRILEARPGGPVAGEVAQHVKGCAACAELVALHAGAAAGFGKVKLAAPPRVWNAIEARMAAGAPGAGSGVPALVVVAAVAVALVAAAVAMAMRPGRGTSVVAPSVKASIEAPVSESPSATPSAPVAERRAPRVRHSAAPVAEGSASPAGAVKAVRPGKPAAEGF